MENKEEKLIKALETLNSEYLELKSSKEYRVGSKVLNNLNLIKSFKFGDLIRDLNNRRKFSQYENKIVVQDKSDYIHEYDNENYPKVAIYTCILGGYDELIQPLYVEENFQYFVFTDAEVPSNGIWEKKDIPKNIKEFKNNTMINRYIKFHPSEFFGDFDYAIYVDGNVRIISDIRNMLLKSDNELGLAMHKHCTRDCIYDEIEVCKLLKKGNPKMLEEQVYRYKNNGFPQRFGLLEATMIISNMKNENSKKLLDAWWNEFKSSESFRDQIALPYVLWKNNYSIKDVGDLGENIYINKKIQVKKHK